MGDLLCTNLTQIWNAFVMPSKCQVNWTFGSRCDGRDITSSIYDSSIFYKKQMIQSWQCLYSCFTSLFFSRTGEEVAKILYYNILQQLHSKFFFEFFSVSFLFVFQKNMNKKNKKTCWFNHSELYFWVYIKSQCKWQHTKDLFKNTWQTHFIVNQYAKKKKKRFCSFSCLVYIVHSWVFLYFHTYKQPNSCFSLALFSGCMKYLITVWSN